MTLTDQIKRGREFWIIPVGRKYSDWEIYGLPQGFPDEFKAQEVLPIPQSVEAEIEKESYKYTEAVHKSGTVRTFSTFQDGAHFGYELGRNQANAELDSLKAMINLWQERNAENVREIEVLKAKLQLTESRLNFVLKNQHIKFFQDDASYKGGWIYSVNDSLKGYYKSVECAVDAAMQALKQITEVEGENEA
jgi:hypothetical protein